MGFETLLETLMDKMKRHTDINKLWSLTPSGKEILKQLEKAEKELEGEG